MSMRLFQIVCKCDILVNNWFYCRNMIRFIIQGNKRNGCEARLRRIVTCIGPNQKNQPNLELYLVRRYKICRFPIVVSYLCMGQNQKNQTNLVLYLVRRSKIFVSVATLNVKVVIAMLIIYFFMCKDTIQPSIFIIRI